MVWLAFATENDCVTAGAAFHVVLPLWLAVMVQVPTATKLTVVPLNVQMLGVLVESVTGRPEDAVAVSVIEVPTVRVPGLANEMFWLLFGGVPRHDLFVSVQNEPAVESRKYEPLLLL